MNKAIMILNLIVMLFTFVATSGCKDRRAESDLDNDPIYEIDEERDLISFENRLDYLGKRLLAAKKGDKDSTIKLRAKRLCAIAGFTQGEAGHAISEWFEDLDVFDIVNNIYLLGDYLQPEYRKYALTKYFTRLTCSGVSDLNPNDLIFEKDYLRNTSLFERILNNNQELFEVESKIFDSVQYLAISGNEKLAYNGDYGRDLMYADFEYKRALSACLDQGYDSSYAIASVSDVGDEGYGVTAHDAYLNPDTLEEYYDVAWSGQFFFQVRIFDRIMCSKN